jgi:hypothetical protein
VKTAPFEYDVNCNYSFQFVLAPDPLLCVNFSEKKTNDMDKYIL